MTLPVPVSVRSKVPSSPSLLTMRNVVDLVPTEVGVKVTLNVLLPPPAMKADIPVVLTLNCVASPPVTLTDVTDNDERPRFCSVKTLATLETCTACGPKLRLSLASKLEPAGCWTSISGVDTGNDVIDSINDEAWLL